MRIRIYSCLFFLFALSQGIYSQWTISGIVSSELNDFDKIPNAEILVDGVSYTTTAGDGSYSVSGISAGNHVVTVTHPYYFWENDNETSASKDVYVNGNEVVNFQGRCLADPIVTCDIPDYYNIDEPFEITVTFRNRNYAVIGIPAYLDISFPDITGSGYQIEILENTYFNYPTIREQGQDIWHIVNQTNDIADYLLFSFDRTGTIFNNTDFPVRLRITTSQSGPFRIYAKASVGDRRFPAAGVIGQQGVYELSNTLYVNHSPGQPYNENPPDGSLNVSTDLDLLSWSCTDPDNNIDHYRVYLEKDDSTPDELIGSPSSPYLNLQNALDNSSTYYWQVIAVDELGSESASEVWSFTTEDISLYTISGTARSDRTTFDRISGASVFLDDDPATEVETDINGAYSFGNVPPGQHTVTIKHEDYWWEGNVTPSLSKSINLVSNQTLNFEGHCRAVIDVAIQAPESYTAGSFFDVTVILKNISYPTSKVIANLDFSFPDITDSNYNIEILENAHFTDPPLIRESGEDIYKVENDQWVLTQADYLLYNFSRNSPTQTNEEYPVTLRIRPQTPGVFRIHIKSNIGDKRYPLNGIIGQQNLYEQEIIIPEGSAQTYEFDFEVVNVTGTSTPVPGDNGQVNLHYENWDFISTEYTNSNGIASFSDIYEGVYNFEVYHDPGTETIYGREFWGNIMQLNVPGDINSGVSLTRYYPFKSFEGIQIFENDVEVTRGSIVQVGSTIKLRVPVENPDMSSHLCAVSYAIDTDRGEPYEHSGSTAIPKLVNPQSTTDFEFEIDANNPGTYYGSFGVLTEVNNNYIITDGTGWNEFDPLFIIQSNNPIGNVELISPNGGETWGAGTKHEIDFNVTGNIEKVLADYSIDGGTTWEEFIGGSLYIEPGQTSGTLFWEVPVDLATQQCVVRVIGVFEGDHVVDISDNVFTITQDWDEGVIISPPGGYQIGGENYIVKEFLNGEYYMVYNDAEELITDYDAVVTVASLYTMGFLDQNWDYGFEDLQGQIIYWEDLYEQWKNLQINVDPDFYKEYMKRGRISKNIIAGALIIAGAGAIVAAPFSGGTSIAAYIAIAGGTLGATSGIMKMKNNSKAVYNALEDEYYFTGRQAYFSTFPVIEEIPPDEVNYDGFSHTEILDAYRKLDLEETMVTAFGFALDIHTLSLTDANAPLHLSDFAGIIKSLAAELSYAYIDGKQDKMRNDFHYVKSMNDHNSILATISYLEWKNYEVLLNSNNYSPDIVYKSIQRIPALRFYYYLNYKELASDNRIENLSIEEINTELTALFNNADILPFNEEKELAEMKANEEEQIFTDYISIFKNTEEKFRLSYSSKGYNLKYDIIGINPEQKSFTDVQVGESKPGEIHLINLSDEPIEIDNVQLTSSLAGVSISNIVFPDSEIPGKAEFSISFDIDAGAAEEEDVFSAYRLALDIYYIQNHMINPETIYQQYNVLPNSKAAVVAIGSYTYLPGETVEIKLEFDTPDPATINFSMKNPYGYEDHVATFNIPSGPSVHTYNWTIPNGVEKGQYTSNIVTSSNGFQFQWESPRTICVLPNITGDWTTFDFSNVTLISSPEDFEIAERLHVAIDGSDILYEGGIDNDLTAQELLDAMMTDNLILIGGPESNPLVESLLNQGKIDISHWENPGDAGLVFINDPFVPLTPAGLSAVVVAGHYLEDTYLSGLKLLELVSNYQNQPPVASNQSFQIIENEDSYGDIGIVQATDPESGILQYILNNHQDVFSLNSQSGTLSVLDPTRIDHEESDEYPLQITISDNGNPSKSTDIIATIKVLDVNEIPLASDVTILPGSPKEYEDLYLYYVFQDPESDQEIGSRIRWYNNGIHQSDLDNTNPVRSDFTTEGDQWYASIQPSDGELFGVEVLSGTVTIGSGIEQDSLILVEFYNATDGPNWTNNTNWLTGPVDTWHGITVDNSRVTGIGLPFNNLTGTIPSSIGQLTSLTGLGLYVNNLTGEIPSTIGNLRMLTSLNLYSNELEGNTPEELYSLTNLEYLTLMNNKLTGAISSSISNLTQLQSLSINNNSMSGDIPSELYGLTNLYTLRIGNNDFTNVDLNLISQMPNVCYLDLSGLGLTGNIPSEILNMPALYELDLSGNDFYGSIPDELYNHAELRDLNLGDNRLSGSISPNIGNLTDLWFLGLHQNEFTGAFPSTITQATDLRFLIISMNTFTDFPVLSGLNGLWDVFIHRNALTFEDIEPNVGVASDQFIYFEQAPIGKEQSIQLNIGDSQTLSVVCGGNYNVYQWFKDNNPIAGAQSPDYILTINDLTDAGDYTCQVTNTIATELTIYSEPFHILVHNPFFESDSLALVAFYNATDGPNWTNNENWLTGPLDTWHGITVTNSRVSHVSMINNGISGDLPIDFYNLDKLTYIYLSWNNLTGPIASEIQNLSNLEYLSIQYNNMSGDFPGEICLLPNLGALFLSGNSFTGSIPSQIGNLSTLTYFDVAENSMSGDIPNELYDLFNLSNLRLNNNDFSNIDFQKIGQLTELEYLGLGSLNLNGTFPLDLLLLSNLRFLNLSDNSFTGQLPDGLFDLSELYMLNLSRNQFNGEIPENLGNLLNMRYLYLWENSFSGAIPTSISQLSELEYLLIYRNSFNELPELTSLSKLQIVTAYENEFTFEDIEPNIGIPVSFYYSPQAPVGEEKDLTISSGQDTTLSVVCGGDNNQYLWYHDNTLIPGANQPEYHISSAQLSDAGDYHCQVTNSVATELTIYSQPIHVAVTGQLNFNRTFVSGWNWFSVNVLNDDMSLDNLLSCATDLDYIKSQSLSATFYEGYGWFGSLEDAGGLNPRSLYKIKAVNPCAADYEGMPVDVNTTPIDLVSGWNWIGYLPQDSIVIQPANDALSSLILEENDYIKNQTESATFYEGYGWFGSLEKMRPTDGYMMSKQSADVLIYPESPAAPASAKKSNASVISPNLSIDPHNFEFNGSVTARVYMDGEVVGSENDLVLAYVDSNLRGVIGGIYFEPTESFAYPLMVYSNVSEGEALTFKYYDAEEDQLYPCKGTLTFYDDMIEANAFDPFELHVKSAEVVEDPFESKELSLKVYPNPFKDILHIEYNIVDRSKVRIAVYDMLGKVIEILDERTLDPGSYSIQWNAESHPESAYFLKLFSNDSIITKKIMLIK